jgi:TP901 family phage tail tape measure protein
MAEDANARIRVDIDTAEALANIKNLQRQISAFHTSMAKGGAAAAATSLNMQQGLLNSINQTGKFSATIRNVKSTTDSFTDSLQKNKLSMGEYFRYAGASTKTFGKFFRTEFDTINKVARERVKDLQTQYIKMGRDANGAMRAIAVRPLALDMENLATKTQIAAQRQALLNQLLKQGSTNLLNFGKNTQWAGRQLMVGFTVPLVMLGSVAAKTFMDMEKQAVRFKRVYGEMFTTTEQTNKALEDIKNLGNEFTKYGIAVAKTMELAADIAATGKMGAELTAQVAETTRLAILGGVEQAEALQATISLTDAFGVSAEDLAGKIDFLNAVENQTITSIEDLTIAIPKAGPVVQQLGGDVEDLTFFLTAMREGGINASEGANALKSGLAALINPTGKASEMLQGFGINIKGIVEANAGDVKGLVLDFATALDTLDPLNRARAIEQLFGKFQFSRLSTLFQNVIKDGNQASRVLKLTNATTEELAVLSEREMKRIEDSPMFKFQKAIEDIKVTLVPLGEAFLKAVTPLLEFGTSILKKFNELDEGAKGFVVGLTAIAGVIGPVFLMGFGLIANGVANVIKMFAFFKASLNKAGTASTELGMQTDYMTQQQLEAAAVAASLDQVHQKLRQTFTSETAAVNALTAAYSKSIAAQGAMTGGAIGRTRPKLNLASGIMSVPGPRGAGDVVPAMLSPGEAVIPAEQSKKYSGIISSLIADNVPGFRFGRNPFASMLGRSKVAVRMKDSDFSSELAASGKNAKYKSAFDTQTGADYIRPSGSVNERQKELRSAMERDVFGLDPKTTPTSARPTYGYARTPILSSFINKLFGIKGKNFNAVTRNVGEDSLAKYGNIDLVTKGSVAKRSSAFAGDALVRYHWAAEAQSFKRRAADLKVRLTRTGVKPAPMKGASPEQLGSFDGFGSPFKRYDNEAPAYVETYTPGGFAFSEIDKIIARDPAIAKRLKAELRAAGLGNVRVTGSNFAARLFKQLGVPGYEGGTESVGPLTEAAAKKFAEFKKESISTTQDKTRGATADIRKAHENLTYSNAQKELDDFIKIFKEQARADGVPEEKIQSAVEKYKRAEVSHIAKDTRTVMMDGTPVEIKNWRSANLVRDFGAVNQLISHIEQTNAVDANGKKIPGKKLIPSLDPKEIAAMAGISEREAKKELKRLGRGEHPITARSSKVLMAVADKYLLATKSTTGPARMKALKHILAQRIADGSFFAAAQSGQLSLPKKLQADFDKKELEKQNTYLGTREKGLKKARSQLIGSGSGVSKPAKVKRDGGSPKDTRLKLLAQGETVLTNDTTDTLRKGGSAQIPGVGRIIGYGRNGRPIRVAGAYGGIPEGQTQEDAPRRQQQRDPVTGRFVSSKAQAPQVAAMPGGGMSGKIAGGATAAGMGAMMYGMTGGPGADLAMMASMPLMMAPMLGKLAPVVLALGALAAGAFALKNAFDSAEKASRETTLATGASTQAITAFAEFAGKASAGEIMDKRRGNALEQFGVQSGKETFGNLFLQTEAAKPLLDGLMASVKSGTSSEDMVASTKNQLATAMASGALSRDEAASIAASVGQAIGDRTFGIKVIGELNELVGVDGSNLLENPIEVRVKLIEETNSKLRAMAENSPMSGAKAQIAGGSSLAVAGGVLGGAAGAAGGALAGAKVVSLVGALANAGKIATTIGRIGALGGPIGLVAGSIVGAAAGAVMLYDGMQKAGAAAGAMSAQGIIALQQNQEMLDSLDLEYEKRIAVAKAANDLVEVNRLIAEQEQGRQQVLEASRDTVDMLVQQYQSADFFGINPMGESLDRTLDSMYKDDPLMQQVVTGSRRSIEASSGTAEQEYTLKLMLASGNVDPGTMTNLMNVFGNDQDAIQKIVDISLNLGSADAGRAFALANLFEDGAMKKDFLARIETKTPQQARKTLEMFEVIQQAGGVLDMQVVLDAYMKDPAAGDKLVEDIEEFRAAQEAGPITVDIINRVFNAEAADAVAADIEYFNSLDKDMQVVYLTTLQTAFETIEANPGDYQIWAAAQGNKPNSEKDYAIFKANQASDAAQRARTLQSDMEEETSGGGGGGPTASSLDDILKKLRDIRKNQIGVAKGFEASAAGIKKLFGGGTGINLFSGIENDMRRLGAEEDLIDLIIGMDPEEFEKQKNTLFNFDRQTGEIVGFKDQLQSIGRALSAIALGQYVSDQQKSAKESRNQVLAFNQLRAAGYSVADAYEAVQDAAVASAIATGNVTRDQMATMLQELKAAQAAMKEAARLTPEGLQEVFEDGFNKAMEAFDAKERKLTFDFELKIKDDQAIITAAENQIAKIRYEIDDYEASLRGVEQQEEAINKTYDTKLEALEKVRVANQKVLDQEKGRLSVAEAITRGDLAATARAVQDLRQNSASGYFSSQTDALNAGRQSALDQIRTTNGLSRIEIEEKIKKLTDDIFDIEEKTLEPANERIRLAQIDLDARIEEEKVLGRTRDQWNEIKINIDLARVNSLGYKEAMDEALAVVQDVLDAWNEIEKPKQTVHTIVTVHEGQTPSTNLGGDGDGDGDGDDDTPPAVTNPPAASTHGQRLRTAMSSNQGLMNEVLKLSGADSGSPDARDAKLARYIATVSSSTVDSLLAKHGNIVDRVGHAAKNWWDDIVSAFSPYGKAAGGLISGPGTGTSDSIPTMLSNGEYVIKASTVKQFGTKMFDNLNAGSLPIFAGANSLSTPRFASVGSIASVNQSSVAPRQAAASSSNSVYNYSLSVNVASQADPNTIAQTVMAQLQRVDSQRVRNGRF